MNKTQQQKIRAKLERIFGLVYKISIQESNPVFFYYAPHVMSVNCYQYKDIDNVDKGKIFTQEFYIDGELSGGFDNIMANLNKLELRIVTILIK